MRRSTKRRRLVTAAVAATAPLAIGPVWAANPHFVGAATITDAGSQLIADGRVAGLGNRSVTVSFVADGFGTARCRNRGGNEAPGQNPVSFSVKGTTQIIDTDHNGNEPFTLSTGTPNDPTAKEAGCPNNNWQATFVEVRFTRAVLSIPGDSISCSFPSGGTNDGNVTSFCN